MKKIIIFFIVAAVVLSFAACGSNNFSEKELFAGRANWTISRNLHKYNQSAADYAFITVEYFEANGARVVRADLSVRIPASEDDTYERYVFMASDDEQYIKGFLSRMNLNQTIINDTTTGIFLVNLEGFNFSTDKDNLLDKRSVVELLQKYHDTGDKSIFGMEE